jgi:hypothetical protein
MTAKRSDIVFQEERVGVVLIERESGRREWYWAREIPDAESAGLNSSDTSCDYESHGGHKCMKPAGHSGWHGWSWR